MEMLIDDNLTVAENIYAMQLVYGPTTTSSGRTITIEPTIFSARDVYVWPSDSAPGKGWRVANFPSFGHWKKGKYDYHICEGTFVPQTALPGWIDLIHHAFGQWEEAAPDLLTISGSSGSCETDGQPISNHLPMTVIRALFNENNEIYMVDPSNRWLWPLGLRELWITAHNKLFFCIMTGADACVISPRYWDPTRAPGKALNNGSVDVLIHHRRGGQNTDLSDANQFGDNQDVSFNTCFENHNTIGHDNDFINYWLMVHEAGHALGLSQFSYLNPVSQGVAHPNQIDSVMNYDTETGVGEPDCSPHPLDIMAIYALYQTLSP